MNDDESINDDQWMINDDDEWMNEWWIMNVMNDNEWWFDEWWDDE